jgi:asparagine N-glycosylation enzyme membrane subunit Stt3
MAEVIRKYPYYRVAALGLGVVALAAVALSRRGWVNGAAAGVLLLVVAQATIDHYSEGRATQVRRPAPRSARGAAVRASSDPAFTPLFSALCIAFARVKRGQPPASLRGA